MSLGIIWVFSTIIRFAFVKIYIFVLCMKILLKKVVLVIVVLTIFISFFLIIKGFVYLISFSIKVACVGMLSVVMVWWRRMSSVIVVLFVIIIFVVI